MWHGRAGEVLQAAVSHDDAPVVGHELIDHKYVIACQPVGAVATLEAERHNAVIIDVIHGLRRMDVADTSTVDYGTVQRLIDTSLGLSPVK